MSLRIARSIAPFLLFFGQAVWAQSITGLHQIAATWPQVAIAWFYPGDCTVTAGLDNGQFLGTWSSSTSYAAGQMVVYGGNFWTAATSNMNSAPSTSNANWSLSTAYDVDSTKFTNSNDAGMRYPFLQNGNYHQFVIGTATVPSDPYPSASLVTQNGFTVNYSRALEQGSLYNIQVTCGSSTASIQASTQPLSPGDTYHYPFAITTGGQYAGPTPSFTMGATEIDPSTGVLLTELTQPGIQQQHTTDAFATNGTGISCSAWTNPTNLYSTSTGVYASVTSSGFSNACAALFGGSEGLSSFQYGIGALQWDGFQLSVTGYGTSSEPDVSFCFTLNGTTCAGPTQTLTLPPTNASTQIVPGPSTTAITPIDTTWLNWQYAWGSVSGLNSSDICTTAGNGIPCNPNFGVIVWKGQSDSNPINLHIEMTVLYSKPFLSPNGGENIPCSSGFVADSNGLNGVLCHVRAASGSDYIWWLSDQTKPPTVRFVGDNLAGSLSLAGSTFNSGNAKLQGFPMSSDVTATDMYGVGTDTNGKLHLLECQAPATTNSYWSASQALTAHACPYTNSTTNDWVDLTPAATGVLYDPSSTSDSLIDEWTASKSCTLMPTTFGQVPCFTGVNGNSTEVLFPVNDWSVENAQNHYVVLLVRGNQNTVAWHVIMDASTNPATVVNAYPSWLPYTDRWDVHHTAHETGPTNWITESGEPCGQALAPPTNNGGCGSNGSAVDGAGPWSVTVEENFTTSSSFVCVDTNLPSETEGGLQTGTPTFNELQYVQSNDAVHEEASGENMLVTGIIAPNGVGNSCSSPSTHYELQVTRGLTGSPIAGTAGDLLFMKSMSGIYTAAGKFYLNFTDSGAAYGDPAGTDSTSAFMDSYSPSSYGCSWTNLCTSGASPEPTFIGAHESYYNGYDIGEADNANACIGLSHPGASCYPFFLKLAAPFGLNNGATGNPDFGSDADGSYQPHPAAAQGIQYAANQVAPASDEDILNFGTPWGCTGLAHVTGTGNTNLWKCTAAHSVLYKGAAVMVFDSGIYPLVDVSGHGSIISDSNPFSFCIPYAANECQSGSSASNTTVYVDDANITSSYTTCTFSGTGAAQDYTYYGIGQNNQGQICVGQLPQMMDGVQAEAMTGNGSNLGSYFTVLSDGLVPFGRYSGLATAHTFESLNDVMLDSNDGGELGGVRDPREELWLAQVPPYTPVSTPGYDFNWVPVTIPTPPSTLGVSTAEILFGYDQNFYCTSRQEACGAHNTSVTTSDPFDFESTDSITRPTCSSGCTIMVPKIPGRLAYYEIRLYSSTNTIVSTYPIGIL